MLTNLGGMLLAGILFSLLFFIVKNSIASNDREHKNELDLIHEQIGFLLDENQNQNHEIAVLKEMVGAKGADEIRHPLTAKEHQEGEMEDPMTMTRHHYSSEIARRSKRPVRLLPAYLFERPNNETLQPPRFYGPPTNCSDLSRLGYTLNGFYTVTASSVNLSITTNDPTKLETVYCSFKQPEGTFNPFAVEKRIPQLLKPSISNTTDNNNARSAGNHRAHFHVLRTRQRNESNAQAIDTLLFFDKVMFISEDILMAGDVRGKGAFVAPKSGVYQFFFTMAMASIPKNSIATVSLVLRSSLYAIYSKGDFVVSNSSTREAGNSMVIGATLKLAKNDKILFATMQGGGYEILSASFSGSLLEELQ